MTDNIQEGAAPPDRNQRQACWDARDAYFACLDNLKVDVPGQEGRACLQPRQAFGSSAPTQSWEAVNAWKAPILIVRAFERQ